MGSRYALLLWCAGITAGPPAHSLECAPIGATAMSRGGALRSPAQMVAALDAEIAASVARDAPRVVDDAGAVAAVAEIFRSRRYAVLLLDGRVIVDRKFLAESKHAAHVAFVASVMERAPLANAVYRFSAGTRGIKRRACRPAPTAVITKVNGYDQCGVLASGPRRLLPSLRLEKGTRDSLRCRTRTLGQT